MDYGALAQVGAILVLAWISWLQHKHIQLLEEAHNSNADLLVALVHAVADGIAEEEYQFDER